MARNTVEVLINLIKKGVGAKEAEKELTGLEKATRVAGAAMSAFATVETARAVYELGKLGAQSLRTERSFEAISGSASEAEKRLDAMRRATRGAISEQQMMSAASRMMQMGLANNSEELEKMAGMAVRLGGAMGKDATGAIEEWNLMIANQSIPRLDTFGVSASRVRVKMKGLQAATADMTREEAFMIAVTEEGEASLARLGETAEDEMLAFEQLEASTDNLKTAFAQRLAPAVAEVAKLLGQVTRDLVEHETGLDDYERGLWELGHAEEIAAQQAQELMRTQMEAAGAMGAAADGTRGLTIASDEAAMAQEGLSTSARRVAGAFGEMVFDEETMWNLALASGASVESLSALAQHLGIATEAEIQNALGAQRLIEGYAAGQVTLEELSQGYRNMATETLAAKSALAESQGEIEYMRGGMVEAEDAADIMTRKMVDTTEETENVGQAAYDTNAEMGDLTESLLGTHDAFSETRSRANELRAALNLLRQMANRTRNALDDLGKTTGREEGMQAGGIWGGGAVMVGEGGPELTFLPRGSRVIPAWETRQMVRSSTDNRQYHRGGDTIIVQDPLTWAMIVEERRRATDRNLRMNM